nr:MAG TPA: hypothetical protein [Caudoviricetes sp.]
MFARNKQRIIVNLLTVIRRFVKLPPIALN